MMQSVIKSLSVQTNSLAYSMKGLSWSLLCMGILCGVYLYLCQCQTLLRLSDIRPDQNTYMYIRLTGMHTSIHTVYSFLEFKNLFSELWGLYNAPLAGKQLLKYLGGMRTTEISTYALLLYIPHMILL